MFYRGNSKFDFVIIFLTIILPIIVLVIAILLFRNVHDDSIKVFTQQSKHGILVAMVLTGTIISVGVIVFDVYACVVAASGHHEYEYDIKGRSLNFIIVYITLACDIVFFSPLFVCIMYVCVCETCCTCFSLPPLPSFILPFYFLSELPLIVMCCISSCIKDHCNCIGITLLGKKSLSKIKKLSKDEKTAIMFLISLMSPMLCFSSHVGYIMLSWLTEPEKCTTILVLFYFILVFFLLTFRKCYKHCSRINIERTCCKCPDNSKMIICKWPDKRIEKKKICCCCYLDENEVEAKSFDCCCCCTISKIEKEHINTQACCLIFVFGIFPVGIMAMLITILIVLPLSSEELVTYLFSIFQFSVVIISTHLVYDLYFSSSFSLKHLLQKFRNALSKKEDKNRFVTIAKDHSTYSEIDDAAGAFAAELTGIIVEKFS